MALASFSKSECYVVCVRDHLEKYLTRVDSMTCKSYHITCVSLERRLNPCHVLSGGGKQGFQKPISKDAFMVDDVGALGNMHSERGLTYIEVQLAGHM